VSGRATIESNAAIRSQAVRTLLPDPPPAPFDKLLAERERSGADRRDEVWEGVLHMSPPASSAHEQLVHDLHVLLDAPTRAAGLKITGSVAIGVQDDYRVPDLALHRPPLASQWHPSAAVVVEVISPGDESRQKLGFYAARGVEELVLVDPAARSVEWLALGAAGAYEPIERSRLLELEADQLARRIEWPAPETQ
jgi:Uma2 family endonuclease